MNDSKDKVSFNEFHIALEVSDFMEYFASASKFWLKFRITIIRRLACFRVFEIFGLVMIATKE